MKVSRHIALRTALALALVGLTSCSSDEEQVDEVVQTEDEFSHVELDDDFGNGMLADDSDFSDAYAGDDDDPDDISSMQPDYSGAEFDTSADKPLYDETPSMSYHPSTPSHSETAQWTPTPQGGHDHAYVVQVGDTLSKIAGRIYGDIGEWQRLASSNSIANPHRIYPGDKVFFESNAQTEHFASALQNIRKNTYTVKAGDTLASISQRVFGTPSRWKLLWRYNEQALENPHKIHVGQQLSYVPMQDMKNFLAGIDANVQGAPAKVVGGSQSTWENVSHPTSHEASPANEVYEEVVVEESYYHAEDVVDDSDFEEIIEEIVVDDESVLSDEAVFEDFEDATYD